MSRNGSGSPPTLAMACAALLALCAPGASAQQNAAPVPDLSGYWTHNVSHFLPPESGAGPVTYFPGRPFLYRQERGTGRPGLEVWVGDYTNPILQPWAAEAIRKYGDEALARGEPTPEPLQLCRLVGIPHILLLREPLVFLQERGMVTMIHQRDHQMRRVYLNETQPATVKPSPYGHSVGRYEDDTLVIETVGLSGTGPIDYYGTPNTPRLRVTERYRVIEGGRTLEARFTVDDPGTFTMPWTGIQRYQRVQRDNFEEIRCAENAKDAHNHEEPIPRDDTPDF